MSVIITGMDIPNSCYECRFSEPAYSGNRCDNLYGHTYSKILSERIENCPLKSVEGLIEKIENRMILIGIPQVNRIDILEIIKEYCEVKE